MRLSAPNQIVFIISAVLAALAVLGHFVVLPVIGAHGFLLLLVGYILLAVGVLFKGA